METFDILIVGGGPGGYATAIQAAKHGKTVALFEKDRLGGTCLNVGCIPTKYLVDKAATFEKLRALAGKDILRDVGTFSFRKLQKDKDAVTAKLVGGVRFLLQKAGVTVVSGEATLDSGRVVRCGGREYRGEAVILATGSVPSAPPIPGRELAIDSTGALALEGLPRRMTVIGGGVIGLELASAFAAFGTEITIVEMLPALLANEQPEAAALVTEALKRRGVRIITGAKVLRIERTPQGLGTRCSVDGAEETLLSDQVLMAAGRRPNLAGVDAAKLGLALSEKRFIQVDRAQRTNLDGVYAIGDVAGGAQLAHAAYAEGEAALHHILTDEEPEAAAPIPSCVYTIPCFARVGLTVGLAAQAGYEPAMGTFDYAVNGMALAEGASGRVFAVADRKTTKLLGMTIVGENASELIAFAALAVDKGLTLREWERMIVAHPSLGEMLREAALDAFGAAVHKA